MKKTLSLLLSFIMLICSVTATGITAHAEGWVDQAINVQYDTVYTAEPSTLDAGEHINDMGVTIDRYFDAFKFTVPIKGKVTLNMEAQSKYYLPLDYESSIDYLIYSDENIDTELDVDYAIVTAGFSSARNMYYGEYEWTLPAGTYYLVLEYDYNSFWGFDQEGSCEFSLTYDPNIAKLSSLKISSRGVYSLKLSWGKVGNVTGYQVQRKVGDKFKHIAYTSKNYYTVKDLAAATNYALRVRAYKTIDGKKYFSGWRNLTTPTKPSKVSIKTPTTNSKHQITVKWKAMARGSGYKVQFSRKKDFSTVVATRLVSGKTKTSYTGKNLTKGKKYYVRVRGYKTVDGKKYYGPWSNVKSIKCK